jgi:glycine hydroxymethyltransferase
MKLLENYLAITPACQQSKQAIAYLAALDHIDTISPLAASSILQELKDQRAHLKLIASENYSSLASQLAMGNLLTDKTAEGFPFHRFYSGCENADRIEAEAVAELKKIYKCDHAFVQSSSGTESNLIAFWSALLQKVQSRELEKCGKKNLDELTQEEYEKIRLLFSEQKIVGMSLSSGGHLSHGYRHHISSKMMRSISYGVDPKTERIDYAALAKLVREEKPTILLAGYSSHPRKINFALMREIADSVGAVLIADMAHFAGLVAGRVFTDEFDPVPYADLVTATTYKTLRGPRGGFILCKEPYREIVNKGCPLVLGSPPIHLIAAKLVAFKETNSAEFQKYAHQIVANSEKMASELMRRNLRLVTGGTENHMLIIDLNSFGLTGRQAESALREAKLTVNRNMLPFDTRGPWHTSGIRIGVQAITSLGMGQTEMVEIADIITEILSHIQIQINAAGKQEARVEKIRLERCRERVTELLQEFPLYPEIVLEEEEALIACLR